MHRNKGQFTSSKKTDGAISWGSGTDSGQDDNLQETWSVLYENFHPNILVFIWAFFFISFIDVEFLILHLLRIIFSAIVHCGYFNCCNANFLSASHALAVVLIVA